MNNGQRKTIDKQTRELVYKKYNGHCAYCGCELKYKDMQVDHFKPIDWASLRYIDRETEDLNTIDNYMPSCRMCNFYKSTRDIENFRKQFEEIPKRLEKIFIYRLAIKYGLIVPIKKEIKFYFEKEKLNEIK